MDRLFSKQFLKRFILVWVVGIVAGSLHVFPANAITPQQIKTFRELLIHNVIEPFNKYAGRYKEMGHDYMLIAHPTLKKSFLTETIIRFDNHPLAYKATLSYEKLKELMDKRDVYFRDGGYYSPEKLTFKLADPPTRVIYIDPLMNDPKALSCQLIQFENGKMVKLLRRGTLNMNIDIFGGCEECQTAGEKLQCIFSEEGVRFHWKKIQAKPKWFRKLNYPPDEAGNYYYQLVFPAKKKISKYKYKQTIVLELDKTQKNSISDMGWFEPRRETVDKIIHNSEMNYIYLFLCYNPPETYQPHPNGEYNPKKPKSYYSKGNELKTFREDIVRLLPKGEVMVYALHY